MATKDIVDPETDPLVHFFNQYAEKVHPKLLRLVQILNVGYLDPTSVLKQHFSTTGTRKVGDGTRK